MTAIDLLRWLGETSLALSILIVLVLMVRKPFARMFGARAAYALWLAPAIRLFLPELKLLPAPPVPMTEPVAAPGVATAANGWEAIVAPLPAKTEFITQGIDWLSLGAGAALFLWAAVAFAWFCFHLERQGSYLRARHADSTPASPTIATMAQEIAKGLGLSRAPQLRINNNNMDGPCLIGLFRPVIFLPAGFEADYAKAEQRLVLAHELAHVARGDMAATLAALALQAAHWPNPLAHLFFSAFRTDQEAACDAFVLARCGGAEGNYAAAILKSVRRQMNAPAYGLTLAHPIKERIMLLKSRKKSRARLAAGAAAAAIFTAISLAATASYGFADEEGANQTKTIKIAHGEQKKVTSRTIITADDGETMEIDGVKNPGKLVIEEENGKRNVQIFDRKGKLISEDIYDHDDEMPFETVTLINKKDGKEQTISIKRAGAPHRVRVFTTGDVDADTDFDFIAAPDAPLPPEANAMRWVTVTSDGAHGDHYFQMADCNGVEADNPMVLSWGEDDGDGGERVISREVICLSDHDSADPKARAEHLRKAIARMEESAKRDAERREAMIARLKEQLKEAEKQN